MLPPWLRRFFPSRAAGLNRIAGLYETKFAIARGRSYDWGLRPPRFDPQPVRYATAHTIDAVRRHLSRALGHLSEDVVRTQRFGLLSLVRDVLETEFRAPLAYTLGFVHQDGQRLCHTSIEGLEQMLRTGIAPGARLSLHAWLTLPSHEIIDATFWAVLPGFASIEERQARGLFLHPDQMLGRSYHPQWVGEGFARKVGILKEYEGW
ncbi:MULTISPECIES: hypothetical protein [unclassified Lysobacter]|uniref:hypothetical protein n=1 Tax=unclassified Lysobacter TaxID=2635362 RepID=UPI001BE9442A|nr:MULTISPECIES: hypothetical protein [unclassified Lysobacter]MBT2748317.1 hypothetical protein [Lysobacter sp. ISL-42]MBT2749916.1 hypothetical protein [Lysobacter sp. ISL-50]MBT2781244.1 hypothetical protein [Lysobacter sp. ISL-52]